MLKPFEIPAELLQSRAHDPEFKRWAHRTKKSCITNLKSGAVAILGYANDLGVRENLGRAGASEGPGFFRQAFYAMPATCETELEDLGDFAGTARDLQNSHSEARKILQQLRSRCSLLITIGGGHDWAAADFDIPAMQILHVDTHLDVRPFDRENPHSGMPFRYLAEQGAKIWCLGAQPEHNSPDHWAYAQSKFQGLWSLDEIQKDFPKILHHVLSEIEPGRPLGLSIDMDAFAQATSPGVSAASPRGLTIEHVLALTDAVAKDITHLGFYELNPKYDRDAQSSKLAAHILSRIITTRQKAPSAF